MNENARSYPSGFPLVAIVGRPNVGKSQLFNRLVGKRTAIVQDLPGITRDRIYGVCEWSGRKFAVCDTGGIDPDSTDVLRKQVFRQAQQAVEEADLVLFVVDIRAGIHHLDEAVADVLRRQRKPILLAANKADTLSAEMGLGEFYSLGLGEPLPVSGMHGTSTGDLCDKILQMLPEESGESDSTDVSIVIVGRPNVGKSSTLNRLIGEERSIVHNEAGTTRDSVDIFMEADGRKIRLVDTAGLRRKAKVDEDVEFYSSKRAAQSLERADVAVLVLDACDGVVAQDKRVAGEIHESGKASIIVVNKWDLVADLAGGAARVQEWKNGFVKRLAKELDFMSYAPVLFTSALTGSGTEEILKAALDSADEARRRVATPVLNQVIKEAVALRPPPGYKGEHLKIKYVSQQGGAPPTFVLKCNDPRLVHFSYRRYLENQVREAFGFVGTPIVFRFVK
ncbi:MAG: ribosome biogenesis GTPase Der [bacterium]|nr:ribosome biogenesis GTPase Der [bacterium]